MTIDIKNYIIIFILLYLFYKIYYNKMEFMDSLENNRKYLNNYYQKIADNVIYSEDYEKMYEIGHFYFKEKDFFEMSKYYRPIIDAFMNNKLEEESLELYIKVQSDIKRTKQIQKTCNDFNSCLNTNYILSITK